MKLRPHHVCVQTDRYAESLAFWTEVLGFRVAHASPGFHGREWNTWLEQGGFSIELQTPKGPERETAAGSLALEGIMHVAFVAPDLDAAVRELEGKGAKFKEKDGKRIQTVEGSRFCKLIAPQGTLIEIREP